MATAYPLPTAATPIERILSRFDQRQLADFIEVAISLLDVANDPELEDDDPLECNGDEQDATGSFEEDTIAGDDGKAGDPTDAEEDDPGGGNSEDEGEEVNEAEPLAPLTLNDDRGNRLD